ncbi:MAG: sterol desaturase family protein [Lacibacter sp.]
METYGKILLVAMPVFLILVLLEKLYGTLKGNDTVRTMDMISSLTSGITNITKDVLGLSFAVISYGWMVKQFAVISLPSALLTYLIAFLALDLAGYWIHRINHEYNFFWNAHIIHHSSEEFNLACALRQSISVFLRLFTFFLLPAAVLGVPETVIAVVAPLHLFAQFWYHTQHIGKMGWLEKVIVTPSHHRVHHAINPEYIDRNYSQIFIFWDHLFGTFQEERTDIPPVYGITRPVQTWNPIKINFQHLWLLIRDAVRTQNWKDKFRIWFMPTGWRPADVEASNPVPKIRDVYRMEKFETPYRSGFTFWCWFQLTVLLLLISYLFGSLASINQIHPMAIYGYGAFVFLYVYALTDLMDGNRFAWLWELFKMLVICGILLVQQDWFGLSGWSPVLPKLIGTYAVLSMAGTVYFSIFSKPIRNR